MVENTQTMIDQRTPAIELMVLVNQLHQFSAVPEVTDTIRLRALSMVEDIAGIGSVDPVVDDEWKTWYNREN